MARRSGPPFACSVVACPNAAGPRYCDYHLAYEARGLKVEVDSLRKLVKEMGSLLGDVLEGQDILTDRKWLRRVKVATGDWGP